MAVLRQNYLANRVYENYDQIVEASCKAWNCLMDLQTLFDQSAPETMQRSMLNAVGIIVVAL